MFRALTKPAAPVTAAREALAQAVDAYAAHQASIAGLIKAEEAALAAWRAAREAAAAAAEGPERAKREAVTHLVAVAKGEAGAPPLSIQGANAALADAEAGVAAAAAARDEILKQLRQAEDRTSLHRASVERAARAVLGEEVGSAMSALIDELEGLHRAMIDKGNVLRWLRGHGVVVPPREVGASVIEVDNRMEQLPITWAIAARPDSSLTTEKWKAAFAALKADPGAALPTAET